MNSTRWVKWSLFPLGLLLSGGCGPEPLDRTGVVPSVRESSYRGGSLSLTKGFSVVVEDPALEPLSDVLSEDFYLLTGLRNSATEQRAVIRLRIDGTLGEEEYRLSIGGEAVIEGGSYQAVSMGLVTLLQSVDGTLKVPKSEIVDRPAKGYRGVMLDLARSWHDITTLKDIITLCRWYKINYLHLHLTDDQAFTFPSTEYPELATEGRSYTVAELRELNQYAFERGVTLIPEIDVPGHSTQFVRKLPELFGIGDPARNSFTISIVSNGRS